MMEFSELLDTYLLPTAIIVAQIFAIIVPLLVAVAYLTYFERKVIASMQLRKGPNVVGPFGLLQPLADGADLRGVHERAGLLRFPGRDEVLELGELDLVVAVLINLRDALL